MAQTSFKTVFLQELKALFTVNKTSRRWHLPLLASLCVGIPLFVGALFHNFHAATLASLGGLVILYYSVSSPLPNRMITLLACSFGFLFSFTISIFFSFNPIVSSIAFGIFSMLIHWIILFFKTKPPGSFFFIMIASMASCLPYNLTSLSEKIGYVGLGTMGACTLAFIYGLITHKTAAQENKSSFSVTIEQNKYANLIEALIVGFMMMSSLLLGHFLKMKNPYWITISCLAVLQGVTLRHVWQRMIQRILGTFIGLGFCWFLLSLSKTAFSIVLMIVILQFIVETMIVRNYTLAVVFITPLTLLLTEFGNPMIQDPNMFISIRFWDICVGSLLGAIGGWFIHHERLRQEALLHLVKNKEKVKSSLKKIKL